MIKRSSFLLFTILTAYMTVVLGQNPLIGNQFTADPSARVFEGKVYVYPSHDIVAKPGHGRLGWFCMEDYHVFSSENLTDWTDHGMLISQSRVPWVDSTTYSMWAPDCIYRNGKYYLYFPATARPDCINGKGFTVGVAISDKPYGPFVPQSQPIKNVHGIDPNIYIDKDGQAYLYWAQGNIYAAKLKDNMLELASEPKVLEGLPDKGLKEGPYLFERQGKYYLTYPHVANKIERLEYAIAENPMGPFKFAGVLMDESASGCWTNHQSIIQYHNQWLLFYHDDQLSPHFDKNRSIRADSLFFNDDGTIREVIPTLRGVGITRADKEIQIDRYSGISPRGATVDFVDTLKPTLGWKSTLSEPGSWVSYNRIDMKKNLKKLVLNVMAAGEDVIEVHTQSVNGPLMAKIQLGASNKWTMIKSRLIRAQSGIQDLFFVLREGRYPVELDWVRFEK